MPQELESGAAEVPSAVLVEQTRVLGRTVSGNVITNFTARAWTAALQVLFTPVYISLLGAEAYGLIGFYTSLVIALGFLDQAVSPALIRELARLSWERDRGGEMRDLLRTLEAITITVGIVIGAAVFLFAPAIATGWLKYQALAPEKVEMAVRLMGLGLACQWPSLLYSGGYIGLNRQQMLIRLRIAGMTVQWAGAALALWAIGPWVELFFAWQVLSFALLSLMLGVGLWRLLPASPRPARAGVGSVRRIWRFSAGTFLIGLTASILTQADKLIVSGAAPLSQFAAYSLCFMIVMLVSNFIAGPMTPSLLPHFTQLASKGDEQALASEYHRWTQVVMVVLLPICGVLMVFSRPLLELWLRGHPQMVDDTATLMPWAVLGTLFNVATLFPFVLQLACGWTRLSVMKNVVAVALVVPALLWGVPRLGPVVGTWCWFAVNFGYYVLEVPLVHRRLLRGHMASWWLRDTLLPGAVAAAFFWLVAQAVRPMALSPLASVVAAAATGLAAAAVLAFALPYPRAMMREAARRLARSRT